MQHDELDGTRWALEYLNLGGVSHLVTGRRIPELSFLDGRLAADDGVNRGGGPYVFEDEKVVLGPIATTRIAYPPDPLPEHRLFEYLELAGRAVLHGDFLHLHFEGGELVYRQEELLEEPA
jgi:heat shock protein HslJ